jgi:hypothetical protein
MSLPSDSDSSCGMFTRTRSQRRKEDSYLRSPSRGCIDRSSKYVIPSTKLISADFDPRSKGDVDLTQKWASRYKQFVTPVAVLAQPCIYVAAGAAAEVLRGRYFNCKQGINFVIRQGHEKFER